MKKKKSKLVRHRELRKYVRDHRVLVPKAIRDEIWHGIDLDLLTIVEDAIGYLSSQISMCNDYPGIEEWELVNAFCAGYLHVDNVYADSEYYLGKAAMEYGLLRAFDNSSFDLRHPARISKAKVCAKAALVEAKKEYDRDKGEGASDDVYLFGDDDKNTGWIIPSAETKHGGFF